MSTVMRNPDWRGLGAMILAAALVMTGCGGRSGGMVPMVPISVSLSSSTVVVSLGGAPTYAQITIKSPSETAQVSFVGLPAGVKVTYAASDTNPSGLLTFTAATSASAGTTMPIVTVNSAGQTASVQFKMILSAPNPP